MIVEDFLASARPWIQSASPQKRNLLLLMVVFWDKASLTMQARLISNSPLPCQSSPSTDFNAHERNWVHAIFTNYRSITTTNVNNWNHFQSETKDPEVQEVVLPNQCKHKYLALESSLQMVNKTCRPLLPPLETITNDVEGLWEKKDQNENTNPSN